MTAEGTAGVVQLGPPCAKERPPGTRVGRFEIVRSLGSGGSADVYEAEHVDLGRRVALKIVRWNEDESEAMLARFRREARISGGLRHPNVADVFDTGQTDDGAPYLAMELLRGEPLDACIHRAPLSIDAAVEVARQLTDALACVHERAVVHRDVKPQNVVLHHGDDGHLWVKLIDFGISKPAVAQVFERHITRHGLVVGTPQYMAPELIVGLEAAPGHDVYAAGVLLFECLAGRPPYDGPDLRTAVAAVLCGPAPSVTTFRADCPPLLAALVARAIARSAPDRFASATEMRDALANVASVLGLTTGHAALETARVREAEPTGPVTGVRRAVRPATRDTYADARSSLVPGTPAAAMTTSRQTPTAVTLLPSVTDTAADARAFLRPWRLRGAVLLAGAALGLLLCVAAWVVTLAYVAGPHLVGVLP